MSDFVCPEGARAIPLSGKAGKGKFAIVDANQFELLSQYTWTLATGGYAACWYPRIYLNGKRVVAKGEQPKPFNMLMHRMILCPEKIQMVDHINHDPLDNRLCNLRLCDNTENQRNAKLKVDNTTGFKGVTYKPKRRSKQYSAYIRINGKQKYIGYFDTAEEAALAYDKVAREKFGDFALTNF